MKKGRLRISRDLIKEEFELALLVFSNFVPVFISNNEFDTFIEYWGYSNLFNEVKEGEVIPLYDAVLINEDGITRLKEFVRK